MENPWKVHSIYELQYFNCPTCNFKDRTKQAFVNHAYNIHPSCSEYLMNIGDKSLHDVILPWNDQTLEIKTEFILNIDEQIEEFNQLEDPLNIGIKTEEHIENGVDEDNKNLVCEMNSGNYKQSQNPIHTCKYCGKEFNRKSNLKEHISSIHEGGTHKCHLCNKGFGSNFNLKKHVITVHEKLKNFKCTYCEVAYGQKGDLNRHIKRVHNVDLRSYEIKK